MSRCASSGHSRSLRMLAASARALLASSGACRNSARSCRKRSFPGGGAAWRRSSAQAGKCRRLVCATTAFASTISSSIVSWISRCSAARSAISSLSARANCSYARATPAVLPPASPARSRRSRGAAAGDRGRLERTAGRERTAHEGGDVPAKPGPVGGVHGGAGVAVGRGGVRKGVRKRRRRGAVGERLGLGVGERVARAKHGAREARGGEEREGV